MWTGGVGGGIISPKERVFVRLDKHDCGQGYNSRLIPSICCASQAPL